MVKYRVKRRICGTRTKTRQAGVFNMLLFTNEIGFLIHIYILNRLITVHVLLNKIKNKLKKTNFLPHLSGLTTRIL